MKPFHLRFSIRELVLIVAIVGLTAALLRHSFVEQQPVYLHVFGTNVSKTHDPDRPSSAPDSTEGRPWTRIATIHVYDREPFGMQAPNDRNPAMSIEGRVSRTLNGNFQGQVKFWLDDNNLTYLLEPKLDLSLEEVAFIDNYYYCYVLSRSPDPYPVLDEAVLDQERWFQKPKSSASEASGRKSG
jgi:hypothetical protein